jgi:hypothetical protein
MMRLRIAVAPINHMPNHLNNGLTAMTVDVAQLLTMSQTQLDDLFAKSPAGIIPDGEAKGTAIIAPGTRFTRPVAKLIGRFAWQGKMFDAKNSLLKNKVLYFGIYTVAAKVYVAPSRLDGEQCIVLDYSRTSSGCSNARSPVRSRTSTSCSSTPSPGTNAGR